MNILVLSGGTSAEREVSLESGQCVAQALRERGHHVDEVDPQNAAVEELNAGNWDVAIPMVHGTGGEDGTLQRQLNAIGLQYVGSSAEASELTFDKLRTNILLRTRGIVVPDHVVAQHDEDFSVIEHKATSLADQIVTKPPRQGSSVGVTIVTDLKNLRAALETAFELDRECLIEKYIPGREVTVPVVNGVVLPIIEIKPAGEWYDYQAKYVDEETQYVLSPEGVPDTTGKIASNACRICGVTGIARVDFIVDDLGMPWLLEINTIPGMTSHSLVPKAAAAHGLSLGELCEQAIAGVRQ